MIYSKLLQAEFTSRKEYLKQYQRSELGKAALKRYWQSEKGKLARRNIDMRRRHNKFSLTEYELEFNLQKGLCAICGKSEIEKLKNLVIDHDHRTNKFRALLCRKCNSLLGLASDNPEILEKAKAYLEKYL